MKKTIATVGIVGGLVTGGTFTADQIINPYTDKGTYQEVSIVSDIPQDDKIEISKDEPKVTLSRWNDEERVTIKPQFEDESPVTADRPFLSKRIEFKKGDVTAFVEPKNDTDFDIDFMLDSKPNTNVFTYKIDGWENLDFFYQPELTDKEKEIAFRPENVVGSYAVYHKTKINHIEGQTNYATGKLFHIYRPEVIDAKDNKTWAELKYSDGVLTVTVPQDFLDNATYPVKVDPTFGYTTQGASDYSLNSNFNDFGTYGQGTISESGNATQISAYVKESGGAMNFSYTIFDDDGASGKPLTRLAGIVSGSISATSYTLTSNSITVNGLTAGNYYFCVYGSAVGDTRRVLLAYDTAGGTNYAGTDNGDCPASASIIGSSDAAHLSVYATYTATGGQPHADVKLGNADVKLGNSNVQIP